MYANDEQKPANPDLAELKALSGGALVLRTEDRELYEKIRSKFMDCLAPDDILAWSLVDRLVDDACRSCGPRTAAGKRAASRNALRHGLAAITHRQLIPTQQIEQLAKAICGQDEDAALLSQAQIIAANSLVLRAIREQQIAVIERLRERTAIALKKGDNSIALATARSMQGWLARREILVRLPQVFEKFKHLLPPQLPYGEGTPDWLQDIDDIVPICLKALLQEPDPDQVSNTFELAKKQIEEQERDDYEAVEAAVPDLIRLERYERRAWLRQKRAIRQFIALRIYRNSRSSAA